ncbi:glycosyltransferase [uncultured Parolsenella sp.]|uniref:glycosyltransferase family 2 protein n=1 Tax=uncultured Parolsenella sp. TaxID=2083008 RepID=UPI0027D93D99|nr:glycosyltransferase [uncultured Parolsenella sp.]
MEVPRVSVIVPFYNVRDCVEYCVSSLLEQEYEDSELLLVDDGSTDGTGELLDAYAGHPRVRVFHKVNGGLSDARNFGVERAKGEYVTFVDGDDFVSPYYLSALMQGEEESEGEALVVGTPMRRVVDESSVDKLVEWSRPSEKPIVLSRKEAYRTMLYDRVTESAWGKLFPRTLLGKAPFPVGAYYEDLSAIKTFLLGACSIVEIRGEYYAYVMRQGAITKKKAVSIKQASDYVAALERVNPLPEIDSDDVQAAYWYREMLVYARMRPILMRVQDDKAGALTLLKKGQDLARLKWKRVARDASAPFAQRIRLSIFALAPRLYDLMINGYGSHLKGRNGSLR